MTPEGKVKQKIVIWLKENMPGLWGYSPQGGAFGKGGVPDRLGLWRGVFFAIEAKADRSCTVSDLQWKELRHVQRCGGIAAVLYGFELHKLEAIKAEIVKRSHGFDSPIQGLPVPD